MDEQLIMKISDMLSIYSFKIDAIINLLVESNVFSKEEINDMLNRVMDEAKKQPSIDEYVIEELKNKVFLKWNKVIIYIILGLINTTFSYIY